MSDTKTMAEYKAESRRALAARGGKQINIQLEADAVAAMNKLRERKGLPSDKDAIIFALAFWESCDSKMRRGTTPRQAV
jgi:hypothetical protein